MTKAVPFGGFALPASALLFAALFGGCGFDAALFTPRAYSPTDAPNATLHGSTLPGASVQVMSKEGVIIAQGAADESSGDFSLALPIGADCSCLRILAQKAAYTAKAVVPSALLDRVTDVGTIDSRSTAIAELASYEILARAGSSYSATPEIALAALLAAMASSPTPEFSDFSRLVDTILTSALGASGEVGPFGIERFGLEMGFVHAAGLGTEMTSRYGSALNAAAQGYSL